MYSRIATRCIRPAGTLVISGLLAGLLCTDVPATPPESRDAPDYQEPTTLSPTTDGKPAINKVEKGWTALHVATHKRDADAVARLLASGILADTSDRLGRTPLHLAVTDSLEITGRLIAAGADVNLRDAGGISPIMLAAGSGRSGIVQLLLEAGARVDIRDYRGDSVIDWSRRSSDPSSTRMLQRRLDETGARSDSSGPDFDEDSYVEVKLPEWFKFSFLDLNEDLQEALDAGKHGILVFLNARNCSYCEAFIENSLQQPDIRERLSAAFDVIGMEIFDDSEMIDPAGRAYRVNAFVYVNKASYTPTLIFYGAQAEQLLKIVGYYPPERFRQVLDYLEGERYRTESLREYLQRTRAATTGIRSGIIRDKALFTRPPHQLDRRAGPADLPLMVVFETADCPACERFHTQVLQDERIRHLVRDFEAVQLDAADDRSRIVIPSGEVLTPVQWYERLGLSYSPSVMLFDESGNEVMRLDSETQRYRMQGSLQLVLEKGYLGSSAQLQRWRRERARELLQQVN